MAQGKSPQESRKQIRAKLAASEAVLRVLRDGQWHHKKKLTQIRFAYGAGMRAFLHALDGYMIAESDCGMWVCLPDERTPELAPSEIPEDHLL